MYNIGINPCLHSLVVYSEVKFEMLELFIWFWKLIMK